MNQTVPPVIVPTLVDAPTTGGNSVMIVSFPTGVPYRNIRVQPDAASSDLGDLHTGEIVTTYEAAINNGFVYVMRESDKLAGWVLWQGVTTGVVPVPTPVPTIITLTPAQVAALVNAHTQIDTALEEIRIAQSAIDFILQGIKPPSSGGGF